MEKLSCSFFPTLSIGSQKCLCCSNSPCHLPAASPACGTICQPPCFCAQAMLPLCYFKWFFRRERERERSQHLLILSTFGNHPKHCSLTHRFSRGQKTQRFEQEQFPLIFFFLLPCRDKELDSYSRLTQSVINITSFYGYVPFLFL